MFSFQSSLCWNRVQRYVCTAATVFVMAYAGSVHAQSFESPEVVVDGACMDVELTFTDEVLVPLCAQETWVDRHWMAAGCGDTLMHVQRIRLRDGTAPVVVFSQLQFSVSRSPSASVTEILQLSRSSVFGSAGLI